MLDLWSVRVLASGRREHLVKLVSIFPYHLSHLHSLCYTSLCVYLCIPFASFSLSTILTIIAQVVLYLFMYVWPFSVNFQLVVLVYDFYSLRRLHISLDYFTFLFCLPCMLLEVVLILFLWCDAHGWTATTRTSTIPVYLSVWRKRRIISTSGLVTRIVL